MSWIPGALDVYLRTVSGRSLSGALASGHRFGEDLSEWEPLPEARREVLRACHGLVVEAHGLVLRVHGLGAELVHELDEWIDWAGPPDVRTVKADRPAIACRVLGHEWDTACWRCGRENLPQCVP